ncbi:hypothetical protein HBA55_12910 [Pseudomaricurvus alkylphenolicus]|uniref:hypothetical protein n=1 Tax=Pseudomaricurvus alkylphenolicus TaxID=1306991 RepID=UPI001420A7D4|nr:hypothetical protein [Pseudomaricurvus alkylphenolicus]NIB40494.1 hypothetical protein [Pseudomaricurvus alkylphenolicus]
MSAASGALVTSALLTAGAESLIHILRIEKITRKFWIGAGWVFVIKVSIPSTALLGSPGRKSRRILSTLETVIGELSDNFLSLRSTKVIDFYNLRKPSFNPCEKTRCKTTDVFDRSCTGTGGLYNRCSPLDRVCVLWWLQAQKVDTNQALLFSENRQR